MGPMVELVVLSDAGLHVPVHRSDEVPLGRVDGVLPFVAVGEGFP